MKRTQGFTHRCRACGQRLFGDDARCPEDPTAERVAWTIELTRAYHYIANGRTNGEDVDVFVETYRDGYFPGVTRGDMALAAVLYKAWGYQDVPERRLPEGIDTSPKGIYA